MSAVRVRFLGRNVQKTLEKAMPVQRSSGMSSYQRTWNVLVPSTRFFFGYFESASIPWHKDPSSLD